MIIADLSQTYHNYKNIIDLLENSFGDDGWELSRILNKLGESVHVFGVLNPNDHHDLYGYIATEYEADTELYIWTLIVDTQHRGKGIANVLVNEVLHCCKNIDISLHVRKDNEAAINLYKKHGFTECEIEPNYYHDGMDAIKFILKSV